jgi:hypothetical protein
MGLLNRFAQIAMLAYYILKIIIVLIHCPPDDDDFPQPKL